MIKKNVKLLLLAEFLIAVYMIATLARSEYNSNQIEKYIENLEVQNQGIVQENDQLRSDFEYYTSPQYKEKMAKQNQGLVNPGEKVLIVLENDESTDSAELNDLIPNQVLENKNLPNWKKWWSYFTKV